MTHTQLTLDLQKTLAEVISWLPFDPHPQSPRNDTLRKARLLMDRSVPIPPEEDNRNTCVADYPSIEEGLAAINRRSGMRA